MAYFPAAIAGVSKHSYISGAKYNKGALLWLRYMSADHLDCIGRHLLDLQDLLAMRDRGCTDYQMPIWNFETGREEQKIVPIEEAILIEANALSWRSLAVSQELYEKLGNAPLAPAARLKPEVVPYTPIKLLSYGPNKVAVVRAIREVTNYSFKDAVDAVNRLPSSIEYIATWPREKALACLIHAGATVK